MGCGVSQQRSNHEGTKSKEANITTATAPPVEAEKAQPSMTVAEPPAEDPPKDSSVAVEDAQNSRKDCMNHSEEKPGIKGTQFSENVLKDLDPLMCFGCRPGGPYAGEDFCSMCGANKIGAMDDSNGYIQPH
eukprot:gnl/MRDRNA2_/MRDRNA2_34810_c0_seq1.p1 gnl/MRDRNA2_/MRDRNA2_34810_c0~~gnl/MRDRNA2_/MRDRNA2_34810_c0_seq1.p1  ORF type:complete len:132 (+),score=30.78 gnl/MRDRNA2_/MRDRNA2_34810_c0_seq1:81-476(+)